MSETIKQYVVNQNNIKDILALSTFSKSDLLKFSSEITSDVYNPVFESYTLSEYSWKISRLCSVTQLPLKHCVEKLKNIEFNNFNIDVIYVSQERKEILTVINTINDDILDEYYTKTFEELKPICPECVFMLATEEDIDFSIMPKFDLTVEV